MIQPPEDRRAAITPQLAMRVAIFGGVALALFAIVFFRLWFLQVLSGDQYLAQASTNRVRDVVIQAPRGEMRDRNGTALVENRRAVSVVVSPTKLPQDSARLHALYVRLSHVLGDYSTRPARCTVGRKHVRLMELECLVEQKVFQLPYADVVVKSDASRPVYTYLAERAQQFPGVSIEQVFLRSYPFKEVGAQLFGTVGQISPAELKQSHYRGVRGGAIVGKAGLEYTYDQYLRGRDGATRVQVDAAGQAKGHLRKFAPVRGKDLSLSIDLHLQKAGQKAVQTGISLANANGNPARAGAFVALDPRNGELLAMGSAPSFDPNILTRPITQAQYDAKLGKAQDYPQLDRAIASAYPVGSTFKVITASAALAALAGFTAATVYDDTGTFKQGTLVRQNAGKASYGPVALRDAIKLSVDTFFYSLGAQLNADPTTHPNGGALQSWARKFGLGHATGVDIGGEVTGTLPSPAWRNERNRLQARCVRDHAKHTDPRKQTFRGVCAYADGTNRPWTVGDNTSLAVGQGDFLATPLQMAVAYAAIENGGKIVRPHVGLQVTDDSGNVLQRIEPGAARHISIPGLRFDPERSARRSLRGRRHLGRRLPGLPRAGLRQDRHRPVHRKARPVVVRLLRARREEADRRRRHRRERRLRRAGCSTGGAADPLAVVRDQEAGRDRGVEDTVSTVPIQRSVEDVTRGPGRRRLLLDPWLALAALGLVVCSLVTIKGATRHDIAGSPLFYVERQAVYAVIGIALALLIARFDYSRLREFKLVIYGLAITLNLLVLGLGSVARGSRRWIQLPFFQFQPSEFGKVLLIVALSAFLVDRSRRLHERETTARIMLLALAASALVIVQPDLGTGMVYVAIAFALLFVAGTSGRQLSGLVGLFAAATVTVLVAAPAVGVHVLKKFQVERLTGFVHPSHDVGNATYQINQSLIAIGSGQKSGRGIAHATQTGLNFLPEHHTDFIFSVVGETYGFVGAAIVLSLFALLLWRALRIITLAKNLFGALIAGGILAMLMFQVFVNVGMTIGIMPITGVPLPLMSYGGASVLTTFLALGLLQSIHVQGRLAQGSKGRALILS